MNNYTEQNSHQHKCPDCGAPLRFDPQSGELFCEHCESIVKFEKSANVRERDFSELVTFKKVKDSKIACYRCSNCGAVSVAPRTLLSTSCPYCNSPIVIDDETGSVVKPDTVVPFELTQADAAAQLLAWRRRKYFAPRKFRKEVKESGIRGVFVPVWTFDAQTLSEYDGSVGYHRTRTVRRDGKTYTKTYTEWRHIRGTVEMNFDDITVRANENIPADCFNKLEPFPQEKYRVYDDEYLAGFIADHYTLDPADAFKHARGIMLSRIRQSIVNRYHADVEGDIDINLNILQKSFKYLLVPVYVSVTKYRKKTYNQYVSGIFTDGEKSVGKVAGKAPVSVWKVLLTVLICLAAVVLIGWLLFHAQFGNVPEWEYTYALHKVIWSCSALTPL